MLLGIPAGINVRKHAFDISLLWNLIPYLDRFP